ncbi:MAG: hypothetical protein ACE5J2_05460 [Nitrososphaerales archaeon]
MSKEAGSKGKTVIKYKMSDLFFIYAYHRIRNPSKDKNGDVDDILNSFMFLFGVSRDVCRNYLNALLSSEGYFSIKGYDAYDSEHGNLIIRPEKNETATKAYNRLISDKDFVEFIGRSVSAPARRGEITE